MNHPNPTAPNDFIGRVAGLLDEIQNVLHALPPAGQPLLTISDVAERLAVSTRTVENMVSDGELPVVRVRGARRFEPEAVESFVRNARA